MNKKIGVNDPCPCGSGKKFKKCHLGMIATHKKERFVVSVKVENKVFKIFSLRFYENKRKKIAGIHLYFPYNLNRKGLLSLGTMPANKIRMSKLDLTKEAKVTSHNVKYSHWSDGTVHFSEAGKIYRTHNKKSFSLLNSIGHLFTIQVKGFNGFEEKKDQKKVIDKQFDLDVDMNTVPNETLKITGWWYNAQILRTSSRRLSAIYSFTSTSGGRFVCFALEAPLGHILSGKVLLLCFNKEHFMTKERGTHLLFLGGFDVEGIWRNINKDFNFLALKYPVRNYKKLLLKLGSADFHDNISN